MKPQITIRAKRHGDRPGFVVAWTEQRSRFRVWLPERAHAVAVRDAVRAGANVWPLIAKLTGDGDTVVPTDKRAWRPWRAMGQRGGSARAAALSPERRKEIARNASAARWARARAADTDGGDTT